MSSPQVSIIIPCYNAKKHVAEAIQSALDQTHPNCEVIVIDDGSTDGSLDVIKSFGDRIRWETGANRGGCAARNRGLELSKGEWIQFLDADDFISLDKIQKQVQRLMVLPEGSIAACSWVHFTENKDVIPAEVRDYWKGFESGVDLLVEMWLQGGYLTNNCWLVPRRVVDAVGGWNESLLADQDGEFFGRILLQSGCVDFSLDVLASYRIPAVGNVSKSRTLGADESRFRSWEILQKQLLELRDDEICRRAIMRRLTSIGYSYGGGNKDLMGKIDVYERKLGIRDFNPQIPFYSRLVMGVLGVSRGSRCIASIRATHNVKTHTQMNSNSNVQRPISSALRSLLLRLLPTRIRFSLRHSIYQKRFSMLIFPSTFSEKMSLRIAKDRRAILNQCADKVEMRNLISSLVGDKHLPELIAIAESVDDIDWGSLPEKFAIKASHGSGMIKIIKNFSSYEAEDILRLKCSINQWLKIDYSDISREWGYKNIPRKIILEDYIESPYSDREGIPFDFKLFVFRGKCKMIQVDSGRFSNHRRSLFDHSWKEIPSMYTYPRPSVLQTRPAELKEMLILAELLGKNLDFSRIDLYVTNERIVVGEITMTPEGGSGVFSERAVDLWLGRCWKEAGFGEFK